jgi:hypothetical protein
MELLGAMRRGARDAPRVLFIHGPGGTGKTTLLREFLHRTGTGEAIAYVDLARIDSSSAVAAEILTRSGMRISHRSTGTSGARMLLLDTAEQFASFELLLRDVIVPEVADDVSIVVAGREPPSLLWRGSSGWGSIVQEAHLRPLGEAESREYLDKRGVPQREHGSILEFTHGLPLALSLAAEVVAQNRSIGFRPNEAPDMLRALVGQLVRDVPSPLHARALEASAVALTTNEASIAAMLGVEDARSLFSWLRGLSFMIQHEHGLSPHDSAREAVIADLDWRNRPALEELAGRARTFLLERPPSLRDRESMVRFMHELTFLTRHDPGLARFFSRSLSELLRVEAPTARDEQALLSAVERFEGRCSRTIAERWFARQPQGALVVRGPDGSAAGLVFTISLAHADPADIEADPCTSGVARWLHARGFPHPCRDTIVHRWWMASETYQALSPVMHRCGMVMTQNFISRPKLRFSFSICADDTTYDGVSKFLGHEWLRDLAFDVDGRRYHVLGHDWREQPPLRWLHALATRKVEVDQSPPSSIGGSRIVRALPERTPASLSREAFAHEVEETLRHFHEPNVLEGQPLLGSRIVITRVRSGTDERSRIAALRQAILEAIDTLGATPRGETSRRALDATYVHPAPTQELAADAARLSFSTYRRYLKAGVNQVVATLWLEETSGKT